MHTHTDLRMLGQTTKVQRSTLQEVQAKIQSLRESSQQRLNAKKYDFETRLKDLRDMEESEKKAKRDKKREEKERLEAERAKQQEEAADPDMMAAMGFANFA